VSWRASAPRRVHRYPRRHRYADGRERHKITARTSLATGVVSKRLDNVLQIQSYAGHGSSAASVRSGRQCGRVIYGGAAEAT